MNENLFFIYCTFGILQVNENQLLKYCFPKLFCRWGEEGARETVRLSVGRDTTKQLIDKAVDALAAAVMC